MKRKITRSGDLERESVVLQSVGFDDHAATSTSRAWRVPALGECVVQRLLGLGECGQHLGLGLGGLLTDLDDVDELRGSRQERVSGLAADTPPFQHLGAEFGEGSHAVLDGDQTATGEQSDGHFSDLLRRGKRRRTRTICRIADDQGVGDDVVPTDEPPARTCRLYFRRNGVSFATGMGPPVRQGVGTTCSAQGHDLVSWGQLSTEGFWRRR